MKRWFSALAAVLLSSLALAQAPAEPPLESNTAGTIVFLVLFVGVCVVLVWMIWRKKGDKEEKE